jgi:hypothetical protein
MSGRAKTWTPVAAAVLALAVATTAFCLSDVAYRASEYDGRPAGDVLINGQTVLSIRTPAAGMDPLARAQAVSRRLQQFPESAFTADEVQVRSAGAGRAVFVGNTALITVTRREAQAHLTSPQVLAQVWRTDLVEAVTGAPPPPGRIPEPVSGTPTDWTGTAQKWVPILSVANQGARIGAAQIAGPTDRVNEVKGVAQLGLDFRNLARIYAYVPVSSLSLTRLERVQGVSVWAVGDIKILEF